MRPRGSAHRKETASWPAKRTVVGGPHGRRSLMRQGDGWPQGSGNWKHQGNSGRRRQDSARRDGERAGERHAPGKARLSKPNGLRPTSSLGMVIGKVFATGGIRAGQVCRKGEREAGPRTGWDDVGEWKRGRGGEGAALAPEQELGAVRRPRGSVWGQASGLEQWNRWRHSIP